MEREREVFLFLGLEQGRTSWGQVNTLVGAGILQSVPESRKRIEGINISAELTIRKCQNVTTKKSAGISTFVFNLMYLNQYR